jgi:hypothetical protein
LISLIFGIWRQSISIQSDYQSQQDDYEWEQKNNWSNREIWNDKTVKNEKEFFESDKKIYKIDYKNKFSYKILVFLHLNADRIENIFKITFIISLLLLIINLIFKVPVLLNSDTKNCFSCFIRDCV